jgi:DNA primase
MQNDFLNSTLFPALFERLPEALPEFHFREKIKGSGYRLLESRTGARPDGQTTKEAGKTFVSERTPFYLSDLNGIRGRSIWAYIQERDGLDKAGTFARLCELAEVKPEANLSPEALERMEKAARRAEVFEALNSYYLEALHTSKTAGAERARAYLKERGYTLQDVRQAEQTLKNEYQGGERMELGFCPNLAEVEAYLKEQKRTVKTKDEAGAELTSEEERFTLEEIKAALPPNGSAGRVSITLREFGRIIGFKFRAVDGADPKYLNLEGYKKERHLPGLKRGEHVVFVEGELDMMSAHSAGFLEVAALGGSAVSEEQIKRALQAGAKYLTLALDNDEPGREATRRAVEALFRYREKIEGSFTVFVCSYPEGVKDFDKLLRLPEGKEEARKILRDKKAAARYFAEYFTYTRAPQIAEEHTGGKAYFYDALRPYYKEELTTLHRLLPTSEARLFEFLMEPILEAYFLTWEEIRFGADTLREIEAEKVYRQEAAKKSEEAAALFKSGKSEEAEEILKEVAEARRRAGAGKFAGLQDVRTEAALREHFLNAPPTLSTSFKLDVEGRQTSLKLPAGGISIFAGRPGHGKSRMLVNLALDVCGKHPGEVHYFTYEESAEDVTLKALNLALNQSLMGRLCDTNKEALEGHFAGKALDIEPEELAQFEAGKEAFFELINKQRLNLHFSERSADELADAIRYLHRRRKVSAVFVDYIQLLNMEKVGRSINSRQEEVKAICNLLKDAARETGIPIILAAQFNREAKKPEDMALTHLREAGDIEQTAALVIGLWDKAANDPANAPEDKAAELVVKVLKNRGGAPNGRAVWAYDGNKYKVHPGNIEGGGSGAKSPQNKNENPFTYK